MGAAIARESTFRRSDRGRVGDIVAQRLDGALIESAEVTDCSTRFEPTRISSLPVRAITGVSDEVERALQHVYNDPQTLDI